MPPENPNPQVPPPPIEPPRPDSGEYYKKMSTDDPLAGKPAAQPSQFEFMLKEQAKPKRSFGLPSGGPAKILVLAAGVLVLILIAATVFSGVENISTQVIDLMAQDQEVIRVSQLEGEQLKDGNVQNLAATAETIMDSQMADFSGYLQSKKVKYKAKDLALRTDQKTDTQLQTAAQNNGLDDAYVLYLKNYLTAYLGSLSDTFKITKSSTLKSLLSSDYESMKTLLEAPQFTES